MRTGYKILTFGCQMNLADSGALGTVLNARGFEPVDQENDADIIILNTCSVRQKAEERVFGRLAELSALKKEDASKKIVVVGCMAQRLAGEILKRAPYVDIILGTDRLLDLPQYLNNGKMNSSAIIHTEFGHENYNDITPNRDNKYSAFVTISRGCDNYCTYCIVPYVRGREHSYPIGSLIEHVNELSENGVLEVMFLGQNVNSYKDGDSDFSDLLKRAASETDIKRIRFMTSHPKDMSDKLIATIASEPKMMSHVHLPLQAASDRILKKMGRQYTYEHYFSLTEKLRTAVPDIALTTDLIVGFPTETEAEFEQTLEAVRSIKYDSAFMFRYSPREGTAAAQFLDDVPEAEKIDRLTKLIALQKKVAFEKNQTEVGKIRSVLIDGFSRRSDKMLKGKTEGNKTILFKAPPEYIGSIRNIQVESADSWTLHGRLVN
jgi:tRNA-2-methylthio-N6-dimethylallyladenosine synthase